MAIIAIKPLWTYMKMAPPRVLKENDLGAPIQVMSSKAVQAVQSSKHCKAWSLVFERKFIVVCLV